VLFAEVDEVKLVRKALRILPRKLVFHLWPHLRTRADALIWWWGDIETPRQHQGVNSAPLRRRMSQRQAEANAEAAQEVIRRQLADSVTRSRAA
jgi:hypothetical protein